MIAINLIALFCRDAMPCRSLSPAASSRAPDRVLSYSYRWEVLSVGRFACADRADIFSRIYEYRFS